jgi:hypothetical protein
VDNGHRPGSAHAPTALPYRCGQLPDWNDGRKDITNVCKAEFDLRLRLSAKAAPPDVGPNGKVISPRTYVSTQEQERLWNWGLHEDELLVNRMSVALLAQSILLVAAVGILTTLTQVQQIEL